MFLWGSFWELNTAAERNALRTEPKQIRLNPKQRAVRPVLLHRSHFFHQRLLPRIEVASWPCLVEGGNFLAL